MPVWSHIHPLVVHFPVALLTTAPVLVVLSLLWPSKREGLQVAAQLLLVLGTFGAFLAWASGEAASSLAQRTAELRAVLPRHEHFGQLTALVFAALTLLYLPLWLIPLRREERICGARMLLLQWLWLVGCLLGLGSLVRTGELGGHMVHDLGTHPVLMERTR